jgi:hypothetical protein
MKTLLRTAMAAAILAAGNLKADFFPVRGSFEEIMAWEACQRREVDARYERMKEEAQEREIEYQQRRILEELEQLRNQLRNQEDGE